MAVKKSLKTQMTLNQKQSLDSDRFRPADYEYMHGLLFWLLFIYKLTFKLSEHNKMTECSFNALAFLFIFFLPYFQCRDQELDEPNQISKKQER